MNAYLEKGNLMTFQIELEEAVDCRWVAEIASLPGVSIGFPPHFEPAGLAGLRFRLMMVRKSVPACWRALRDTRG